MPPAGSGRQDTWICDTPFGRPFYLKKFSRGINRSGHSDGYGWWPVFDPNDNAKDNYYFLYNNIKAAYV